MALYSLIVLMCRYETTHSLRSSGHPIAMVQTVKRRRTCRITSPATVRWTSVYI